MEGLKMVPRMHETLQTHTVPQASHDWMACDSAWLELLFFISSPEKLLKQSFLDILSNVVPQIEKVYPLTTTSQKAN